MLKAIYSQSENWLIFLSVVLCNLNIGKSCALNNDSDYLPHNWPCEWTNGVVPFAYDFFALNPNRLKTLVSKGQDYLEQRSCLTFEQHNPVALASNINHTYLFYAYSEVLESCCLPFYSKPRGRRTVLITPVCSLPAEVAHATLHGLGLQHDHHEPFPDHKLRSLLFSHSCKEITSKIQNLS